MLTTEGLPAELPTHGETLAFRRNTVTYQLTHLVDEDQWRLTGDHGYEGRLRREGGTMFVLHSTTEPETQDVDWRRLLADATWSDR